MSIWVTELIFKPAGPLTFRKMPSGSLPIMSYPFMPPTTMSGFLQRLLMIARGKTWPGYGEDWFRKGKKGKPEAGQEYTLTLEKQYRALGAFPVADRWCIHKTRRHGPKVLNHTNFSKFLRLDKDETKQEKKSYQLHHWDYLFSDELRGWVVAKSDRNLEVLEALQNFGGKAGKEGYLYVTRVGEPQPLKLQQGEFQPLGLVPQSARPSSGTFYTLYGHHWSDAYLWTNGATGGVDGFVQVGGWWGVDSLHGWYWALQEGSGFPAAVPDTFLVGDVEPFYGEQP